MGSSEKLKKYQRQKFENFKKINELKIDGDEAYIELKVKDITNIISEYSIQPKKIIKKEFLEAIENNASYIPLDYPLVLEIHNNNFTSDEKILVRKYIKNHFSLVAINKEMQLKAIKRKSHFFLLCGIIGFIVLAIFYNIHALPYIEEITSFIASFSIWEYAELLIFEQDNLKEEIIKYNHLSKIRVVYNKEDS